MNLKMKIWLIGNKKGLSIIFYILIKNLLEKDASLVPLKIGLTK